MDFREWIKPGAIMGYFQDIATEHADISGYGYADLIRKNLAWVILRMSIRIIKNPAIGDVLELVTCPEKPRASDVDRGYYMYNKAGETVICGSSKWCVIDIDTHRIQRLTPLFEEMDPVAFIPYPPFEGANPKLEKLDESEITEKPLSYSVQVTDLDRNVHMNNARYGDAVLNVCGMEALQKQCISRLDINFMSQLFFGDRFNVSKLHKDGVTYIESKRRPAESGDSDVAPDASQDVVFRARAEWDSRDSRDSRRI